MTKDRIVAVAAAAVSVIFIASLAYAARAQSATSTAATSTVGDMTICGRPGTDRFNVCYYEGRGFETFRLQRYDDAVAFDWGGGSPHPTVPDDHFSAKWLGLFDFEPGIYEFTVVADDGVRLYVDNELLIDKWFDQPATTYVAQKTLSGENRGVIVEYYEREGDAVIGIGWRKASDTGTTTPPAPPGPYYPNASPSAWYILPGQPLSFSGAGFAPHEMIRIQNQAGSAVLSAQASGSGSFSSPLLTVPFGWQGSVRSFTVKGVSSGATATPNPIRIVVGTFYPQITPSGWWVPHGESMHVSGTGFAPNEHVRLRVNGSIAGEARADGNGNVRIDMQAPSSGLRATLTAVGLSSGKSSTRMIYLHP